MKRGEDKNILVKAIGNIDKAYVLEAMDLIAFDRRSDVK